MSLLRNDGEYSFFIIQFYCPRTEYQKSRWSSAGACSYWTANVPIKLRWTNHKGYNNRKHKEPFNDFSACGKLWQMTGIHGTFDIKKAILMKHLLQKYNSNHKFRIAEVKVSQFVKPI